MLVHDIRLRDGVLLTSPQEIHFGAVNYFCQFLQAKARGELPNSSDLVSNDVFLS